MKKIVRILCICIVAALTVAMFGGCGGDKNDDTSSNSSVNTEELVNQIISTADVNFVNADGESTYRVVRPESADETVSNAAKLIFKQIKSAFGVSPRNMADDESGDGYAEILLGDTNRESTAKAKQLLEAEGTGRSDEYIICTVDDDIVILGTTDESTVAAAQYFMDNYLGSATITGGINYYYSTADKYEEFKLLGIDRLSSIKVVRPIYNVSWITQNETDKLIELINTKTGYSMELVHDQIASTTGNNSDGSGTLTRTEPTEYEIIIGNCSRDNVKTFTDHDAYEIRIEDKKIYLNGGSPYATAMAVSEFIKLVENNSEITSAMTVAEGDYNSVIGNYDNATYYYPTWYDEFDGTEIDETKWDIRWDEACYSKNEDTGKQGYRGSSKYKNNYVKDGKLYFDGMETDNAYYGGLLVTRDIMDYKFGFIELSNIHPKGNGFWVALYPVSGGDNLPADTAYTQETDVDECYGPGTWVYQNTFAWPTAYGRDLLGLPAEGGTVHVRNDFYSKDDRGLWMDFHTYGYNWVDETRVVFTVDGYVTFDQALREGAEQLAYSVPANLRLAYSVGSQQQGYEPSGSSAWTETNSYINDWVYIFQLKGQQLIEKNRTTGKWEITHQ